MQAPKVHFQSIGVESKAIRIAFYRPKTKELQLSYTSGTDYMYEDVPEHVFEGLRSAESKGAFLHDHILGRYKYERLTE